MRRQWSNSFDTRSKQQYKYGPHFSSKLHAGKESHMGFVEVGAVLVLVLVLFVLILVIGFAVRRRSKRSVNLPQSGRATQSRTLSNEEARRAREHAQAAARANDEQRRRAADAWAKNPINPAGRMNPSNLFNQNNPANPNNPNRKK